jgi:hypothetical protein
MGCGNAGEGMIGTVMSVVSRCTDEQNHGAVYPTLNTFSGVRSAPAVVPGLIIV